MSDDTSNLDEVFDFLAAERRNRRDPEEHTSPEALTAYQANELSPEEDERIQEHLTQCQHCTEMLLELEEFLQPADVEDEPETPAEVEAGGPLRGPLPELVGTASRRPFLLPLASLIGLFLVGYITWRAFQLQQRVTQLQSQVAELQQPVVSPPTLHLRSVRGEGGAREVPAGRAVLLTFDVPVPDDYSEYRAQIMDEEGRVRWGEALNEDKEGRLPFLLIKGYLEPGEYTVRLIGVRQGSLDSLQENRIRVPSGSSGSQQR